MTRVLCAVLLILSSACVKVGATKNDAATGGATGNDAATDNGIGGDADAARPPDAKAGDIATRSPCEAAKANKSAYGCEFYSVAPAAIYEATGSCFAALLSNTSTSPVAIQVSYGGMALAVARIARTLRGNSYEPLVGDQLAPGQVAVLFLAQGRAPGPPPPDAVPSQPIACPPGIQPGVTVGSEINGTDLGKAFLITTSAPAIAYDIYPYGAATSAATSATLLIPTSAWGKSYIAADAYDDRPWVQIVAEEDATKVTITPKVAIGGSATVASSPALQPQTYTISKGQVLQLEQPGLAGSPIFSDKPIGVWGGSSCMTIPTRGDVCCCDTAHQQLLPSQWLGFEYVAVRYRDRLKDQTESVPWTIVGTVDGTALAYDPGPPPGAPTSLDRGEVVRFSASDPFVVRSAGSAYPFYVAGHMTSAHGVLDTFDAEQSDVGDPEYVNTVPPQQWLGSYTFLTDQTYKNTHLVFTRQKDADNSFKDVTLDCVGTVTGWAPVGTANKFEFTRVDFDKKPGGCVDGAHRAHSDVPFGLTVWGWDKDVSYAYPAGLSTKFINDIVVK